MMGFTKFVGEWKCTEVSSGRARIDYTYTLHAASPLFYPFNWMFTKVFMRIYMKHVLRNIRRMIAGEEPYLFQ